jgi:hypothetical protein
MRWQRSFRPEPTPPEIQRVGFAPVIVAATGHTDMRKGMQGLALLVSKRRPPCVAYQRMNLARF